MIDLLLVLQWISDVFVDLLFLIRESVLFLAIGTNDSCDQVFIDWQRSDCLFMLQTITREFPSKLSIGLILSFVAFRDRI